MPIGHKSPEKLAMETVQNDSGHQVCLIGWTNGNGWHGQPAVSSVFEEVYESGRIAVYTCNLTVYWNASDYEDLRSIRF